MITRTSRLRFTHPASLLALAAILVFTGVNRGEATTIPLVQSDFNSNRDGWYSSSSASTVSTPNGSITLTTGRQLITHFDATTLAPGDTLTASFNFSYAAIGTDANSNNFRFGLLNSGDAVNQVTADDQGQSNARFTHYTGYTAFNYWAPRNGVASIRERSGTAEALIHSATAYNPLGQGGSIATDAGPVVGQLYNATFTLERVATGMKISVSITGTGLGDSFSYHITNTEAPFFTFDTFVISTAASTIGNLTIHDASVIHTSAIPEPAQASGLAAAATILFLLTRRSRRGN